MQCVRVTVVLVFILAGKVVEWDERRKTGKVTATDSYVEYAVRAKDLLEGNELILWAPVEFQLLVKDDWRAEGGKRKLAINVTGAGRLL